MSSHLRSVDTLGEEVARHFTSFVRQTIAVRAQQERRAVEVIAANGGDDGAGNDYAWNQVYDEIPFISTDLEWLGVATDAEMIDPQLLALVDFIERALDR